MANDQLIILLVEPHIFKDKIMSYQRNSFRQGVRAHQNNIDIVISILASYNIDIFVFYI